jgi:DNA-binding protein HU-beta
MNKGELVVEFAKRTELSTTAANSAVNTIIGIITDRLKKGDTVAITGFGTFSVTKRAARKSRNPATGEAIKIAEVFSWGHVESRFESEQEINSLGPVSSVG